MAGTGKIRNGLSTALTALSNTWGYEAVGSVAKFFESAEPRILVFWHAEQLLFAPLFKRLKGQDTCALRVLISNHRDGHLVSSFAKGFGLDVCNTDIRAGGSVALCELRDALQQGQSVAVTPDGPLGPAKKAKGGVLKLAQASGCPIVPLAAATHRCWRFRSWDRLMLPKPFAKIRYAEAEKLFVEKEADISSEELIRCLENGLQRASMRVLGD